MKIIKVDNFARESSSCPDVLIAEDLNEKNGEVIVDLLNKKSDHFSSDFFRLVKDDYILQDYDPR